MTLALDDLESADIGTVIVTSADVSGRLVGKRFAPDVFRRLIEEGVALSSCVLGWDVDQWPGPQQAYTGHQTGWHDVRLVPDLATLRRAAWLDRTAICVADFVEMGRDDLVDGRARTILRRQIEHVENAGFTPQVASELEFALYHGTYDDGRANGYETLRPTTLARADYTVQAGDQYEGFFAGVREALAASELGPWTSQVEWGLGQWEINLEYQRALEMADRHILFKLAMRDMAAAAGMSATFMPKPFGDTTGSSCHLHLSLLNASGANVFHDAEAEHGVSATLMHAVGGVLERAPDLMLFYAPTVNSYRRTTSGEFSGNGVSWGYDSRMVSCRVLAEGPESTRLEWRVPGADVNPYLAIAGVARLGRRRHLDRRRSRRAARRRALRGSRAAVAHDARERRGAVPRQRVRAGGPRRRRRRPLRGGRPVGVGAVPFPRGGHRVGAPPLLRGHLRSPCDLRSFGSKISLRRATVVGGTWARRSMGSTWSTRTTTSSAFPFEWFDELRRERPVSWHDEPGGNKGFWAVTRYDDLTAVHMDWQTYSSETGAVALEELDDEQLEVRKTMLEMDPPRHTELRKICTKKFSGRGVAVSTRTSSATSPAPSWTARCPRASSTSCPGDQPRAADPVPVLHLHRCRRRTRPS